MQLRKGNELVRFQELGILDHTFVEERSAPFAVRCSCRIEILQSFARSVDLALLGSVHCNEHRNEANGCHETNYAQPGPPRLIGSSYSHLPIQMYSCPHDDNSCDVAAAHEYGAHPHGATDSGGVFEVHTERGYRDGYYSALSKVEDVLFHGMAKSHSSAAGCRS